MDESKLPEPAFKVTKSGRVFSHPDEVDCTGRALDVYTADQLRAAIEADRERRVTSVTAWMDPDSRDVITAERKHSWETVFGASGKMKAALYTIPLYAERMHGIGTNEEQGHA